MPETPNAVETPVVTCATKNARPVPTVPLAALATGTYRVQVNPPPLAVHELGVSADGEATPTTATTRELLAGVNEVPSVKLVEIEQSKSPECMRELIASAIASLLCHGLRIKAMRQPARS
jgi:hypothetical protein